MAETHTPGPWILIDPGKIGYARDSAVVKGEEDFDWVATVQVSNVPGWRANARLIAAAPDLLAALEAGKNVLQSYHERCDWSSDACSDGGIDLDNGHAAITDACAAIEKARNG